jgi:class 3 adenylate cyclase
MTTVPDTRYAKTPDGVYLAYQTAGEGPIDMVWQFDFVGNVDLAWERPDEGEWMRRAAEFCRLIIHDRRGTGLSSRNVDPPNLETRVADLRIVLDAVGAERPVLGAPLEGGAPNVLFAATFPDRVRSIFWYAPSARSAWAPDYPWGVGPEYHARDLRALDDWGTAEFAREFAATEAVEGHRVSEGAARAAARSSRHTATPDVARELSRIWYETDVRGVLPSVQAPTLLLAFEEQPSDVEEARYVASLMPAADVAILPGNDTDPEGRLRFDDLVVAVRRFMGAARPATGLETVLSTVLFTDIVGSTQRQATLGDRGWKELVQRHHMVVRTALQRWHGVENDTAGDGFYATFDGPARAIRCAREVTENVRELGIEVRAGVNTGECELIEGKFGGLTVSIGARVAANAGPSEVLVTQTVKDLVAGSGLTFEDAGEHELKGVPGRWRLYRAAPE